MGFPFFSDDPNGTAAIQTGVSASIQTGLIITVQAAVKSKVVCRPCDAELDAEAG